MNTIVPRKQLIPGRWYVGRGRNANVGLWTGQTFLTIGFKFREPTIKSEGYYTDDTGCFQPFAQVKEGICIEPIVPGAKDGWDAHYAKVLDLSRDERLLGKRQWHVLRMMNPEYPNPKADVLRVLRALERRRLVYCNHGVWRLSLRGQNLKDSCEQ